METIGNFKIPVKGDPESESWGPEISENHRATARIMQGDRSGAKIGTADGRYFEDFIDSIKFMNNEAETGIELTDDGGIKSVSADIGGAIIETGLFGGVSLVDGAISAGDSEIGGITLIDGKITAEEAEIGSISFENIAANTAQIGGVNGKTSFEESGHQTLSGTGTVWEDANFDPTMLTGGGTLPTRINFASTLMGVAAFAGNQNDEVSATIEIPHCAKLNAPGETAVKYTFHAHIYPTTSNGGSARFGLDYLFTKEGVPVTAATTVLVTVPVGLVPWAKKSFDFPVIAAPDELGSQMHWRFYRLATDPLDTSSDNIACATIGLHYEIDSIGSREILVK